MEIRKNRYGVERVYEKIDNTRIRITGESLLSRGSEDDESIYESVEYHTNL